jgi:hypothetical protein
LSEIPFDPSFYQHNSHCGTWYLLKPRPAFYKASFTAALIESNSDTRIGWRLDTMFCGANGDDLPEKRGYPYADDLGRLPPC